MDLSSLNKKELMEIINSIEGLEVRAAKPKKPTKDELIVTLELIEEDRLEKALIELGYREIEEEDNSDEEVEESEATEEGSDKTETPKASVSRNPLQAQLKAPDNYQLSEEEENRFACGVLKGAVEQGISIEDLDLSGMDLSGMEFRSISLKNINFQGCIVEDTIFQGCDFEGADIEGVDFTAADIRWSTIEKKWGA